MSARDWLLRLLVCLVPMTPPTGKELDRLWIVSGRLKSCEGWYHMATPPMDLNTAFTLMRRMHIRMSAVPHQLFLINLSHYEVMLASAPGLEADPKLGYDIGGPEQWWREPGAFDGDAKAVPGVNGHGAGGDEQPR